MRVLVIGSTGVIGAALAAALHERGHEVIPASRRGQLHVDLVDSSSVDAALAALDQLDAVVCTAANVRLRPIGAMDAATVHSDLAGKLYGQLHLAVTAARHIQDGGSITLTGGRFADDPGAGATLGALVNAGLSAFVRAAAAEMSRGVRLNIVSPGWIAETLNALGHDPAAGVPVRLVANAYVHAVESNITGQVLDPNCVV